MFLWEKKLINWITEYRHILFFVCISILAFGIRIVGKDFVSADMSDFLIPWFDEIKNSGGISSLDKQTGDYNLLYQTIIAILTYIPVNCIYLYKILSIIFDYALAFIAGIVLTDKFSWKTIGLNFNLIYAVVLFIPTVVLNSSFWGQCDSIYTLFIVLAVFLLYKEKCIMAFIMIGIAFSFKLQTIFIIPFVIALYFYKKKFSFLNFFVSIIVFELSGIVCFFQGRNILEPFRLYLNQTNTYPSMWLNVASFWWLVGNDYSNLKLFAIIVTIFICGVGLYLIMSEKVKIISLEDYLRVATWFMWTCILFLPSMHERYTYPLDIFLILLCFINREYLKYAIYSVCLSTITYSSFLFANTSIDILMVLLYIFLYVCFSVKVFAQKERIESKS